MLSIRMCIWCRFDEINHSNGCNAGREREWTGRLIASQGGPSGGNCAWVSRLCLQGTKARDRDDCDGQRQLISLLTCGRVHNITLINVITLAEF